MPMGPEPLMVLKCMPKNPSTISEQVEDRDATGGGDDAEAHLVGDLDQAGAVGEQQDGERAEGEADGLHGESGVAEFKGGGDAAEGEAFEQGVERRGDRGGGGLEDGDHRDDEAAEEAKHHERADRGDVVAC